MARRVAKSAGIAVGVVALVSVLVALSASPDHVLAEGEFHQVAHKGSGRASLIRSVDGRTLLRLTNLETAYRQDLEVLLVAAPDAGENETVKRSERISVGAYEPDRTDYPVPDGVDVARFRAVTIWSAKYQVNFTTAPLAWRDGR